VTAPAVETTGLRKVYGSTVALADLSMTVEAGEAFGFLGPNGAGKTTAVRLLLGLASATSGDGRVLGAPIGDRAIRRRVGYLPELFRYQPWLRAREVLDLHADLLRLPRDERRRQIPELLELVGLADRADDLVGGFSKGMQQRLGLGIALLGAPDLVILDEPTSALDPIGRAEVRTIIGTVRERGTAVFLNSHLLTEVERICDRVAIVDHGRVLEQGRLDDILGEPVARIRATDLDGAAHAALGRFGPLAVDGPWLTFRPIDPTIVPEIVAAIVHAGGRVHAVDASRTTLEERFLALVGATPEADAAGPRQDGPGPETAG
jgi:ABC-2 type transport system ATP-binding protein